MTCSFVPPKEYGVGLNTATGMPARRKTRESVSLRKTLGRVIFSDLSRPSPPGILLPQLIPPQFLRAAAPELDLAVDDDEARRLTWYGGFLDGALIAVMGLEYSRDAAPLRHAYILPEHQHHGIGQRLAEHLESVARREAVRVLGRVRRRAPPTCPQALA